MVIQGWRMLETKGVGGNYKILTVSTILVTNINDVLTSGVNIQK